MPSNLEKVVFTVALLLVCTLASAQQITTRSKLLSPGLHFTGGTVVDSATKKSQPKIQLYCISSGDTVILSSNARGNLPAGDSLKGVPDSLVIVSATPGYHVAYSKVKVYEHGKTADQNGNLAPFYLIEVNVRVAKD